MINKNNFFRGTKKARNLAAMEIILIFEEALAIIILWIQGRRPRTAENVKKM